MKYIDADKIRAEIERRIKMNKTKNGFPAGTICAIRIEEYEKLLTFLDTLEEPVGKTCKTCGFYENNCPFIRGKFISYPNKVCKDYTFSTLKAEQEPVSEDLEEAADEWCKTNNKGIALCADKKSHYLAEGIDAFIAGAEWQKAKMMEGAVEGFVGVHLHDKRADVTVNSGYLPKEMGIKSDSKVKIIIVKEEQQ